jgi:hypothetical protein
MVVTPEWLDEVSSFQFPVSSFQLPVSSYQFPAFDSSHQSPVANPVVRTPALSREGSDQPGQHPSNLRHRLHKSLVRRSRHEVEIPGKKQIILKFITGTQRVKQKTLEIRVRSTPCSLRDI